MKNLKLLLRAKASALIVIFAPLLIILILGLSYNTSSQYGLNIGVYSTSFTEDVTSFMNTLQEDEFKIIRYDTTIEDCVEDLKLGFVHTCIQVPESLKVEGNTAKELKFYVDPTKINLVYMIQETLKTKFDFKAQELSQQLAGNILTKLSTTKSSLLEKKSSLDAVKEKNSAAAASASAAVSSLSGLDLAISNVTYNISLVTSTSSNLDTAVEQIDDAITAIDATNLSSASKTEIKNHLSGAKSELTDAANQLDGNTTATVSSVVTALQADLEAAKAKLTVASSVVSSSSGSLGATSATLQESLSSLDSVIAGLSTIDADLGSIPTTDPNVVAAPLVTKIERVGPGGTYLNYLFPALLVLVVMFTSLLLGTTLVMMEKNSPAFLRNFFLPLRTITFIISTYLTTLILIIVQIMIILGVSLFFLKDTVPSLPLVALILILAATVFTFLGMGVGYLFTSEETGVLASISLGSLLLFLSGIILPIESVSPLLREIVSFNPYVLAEKLVRQIFLFHANITVLWVDLLLLIGYAVALLLIMMIAESLLHKHLINRFMRHRHKLLRQNDVQNKNEV